MGDTRRRVLGSGTAESDRLEADAFLETPQYLAAVESRDYNFVVGRRGTGKSAIFERASKALAGSKTIVLPLRSPRRDNIDLAGVVSETEWGYRLASEIVRLAFRVFVLRRLDVMLHDHARVARAGRRGFHCTDTQSVPVSEEGGSYASFIADVLRHYQTVSASPTEIPRRIAVDYHVDQLSKAHIETLAQAKLYCVIMVDGLDEGWLPEESSTSILGGLARAASQFDEERGRVHLYLFVRDNMWRAVAHLDDDYTRDFEGRDIRLTWNKDMLREMVADRLRAASLGIKGISSIKAWNAFVGSDLQGRAGFEWCLQFTLHRPRDLIALLNRSRSNAIASGRRSIEKRDVLTSAREASRDRLKDLEREYAGILPGISTLLCSTRLREELHR